MDIEFNKNQGKIQIALVRGERGLTGEKGETGLSAYEIAVEQGYSGSEKEWLISLKGEKGERGIQGEQGNQGVQGIPGKNALINGVNSLNVKAGNNISIVQESDELTINNSLDISSKQDVLDENLQTISKTVIGAINENFEKISMISQTVGFLNESLENVLEGV